MSKFLIKSLIILLVALLLIPIITIVSYLFQPNDEIWQHLIDTVLFEYIQNSAILAVLVSFLTLLFGVSTAWLTSRYQFFGHKILPLLLMLPMAMPSYIIAFTYSGLLNSSGIIQETIRAWTGLAVGEYWFPDIHNVYGASVMLAFVLYPYIFLLARASFLTQSVHQLQVGEMLGLTKLQGFYRIALPMARPAIVAGLALVIMETLSEYGTVQYYGVPTFTTGIFRTWFGLDDVNSAINLSALLLFFVFVLFGLEAYSRRQVDYSNQEKSNKQVISEKQQTKPLINGLMFAWCLLPFLIGFFIPSVQLIIWTFGNLEMVNSDFLQLCKNSFILALVTAMIAVILTFLIYAYQRYYPSNLIKNSFRLVSLGYAIPAVVIALGVMIPAGIFGNWLNQWLEIGLLHGTFSLLVFAYLVRFMAVALGSVESGYDKIHRHIDDAGRLLTMNFFGMVMRIHLPMMSKVLFTSILIIFVDVLKELPITLVLRPFNFNTLAVKTFELASDEFLIEASLPALSIVLTGIIPVILLNWGVSKADK